MKFIKFLIKEDKNSTSGPIRRFLVRGLFFSLPTALTIWAISLAFGYADAWFGGPTSALVRLLLPQSWLVGPFENGHIPGLSFFVLMFILIAVGALASWKWSERLMRKVDNVFVILPGAGAIYKGTRKIGDLLSSPSDFPFQRVVMIPFMAPECFTIAFVTGTTTDKRTGRVYLRVAVPTPPNPLSSIPAIVPEDLTTDAGMTVEEGLQYCMSLGMVGPQQMLFPQTSGLYAHPAPRTPGEREATPTLPPPHTTGGDGR